MFSALRPEAVLGFKPASSQEAANQAPIAALLRFVSAEWLTIIQYIKSRLAQIEWQVTYSPRGFFSHAQLNTISIRLQTWRRLVPQYRDMLREARTQVLQPPRHMPQPGDSNPPSDQMDLFQDIQPEYDMALARMGEFEERIDRIADLVGSAINTIN